MKAEFGILAFCHSYNTGKPLIPVLDSPEMQEEKRWPLERGHLETQAIKLVSGVKLTSPSLILL